MKKEIDNKSSIRNLLMAIISYLFQNPIYLAIFILLYYEIY